MLQRKIFGWKLGPGCKMKHLYGWVFYIIRLVKITTKKKCIHKHFLTPPTCIHTLVPIHICPKQTHTHKHNNFMIYLFPICSNQTTQRAMYTTTNHVTTQENHATRNALVLCCKISVKNSANVPLTVSFTKLRFYVRTIFQNGVKCQITLFSYIKFSSF